MTQVTIYQIDSKFETTNYTFAAWNFASTHGFDFKDYDEADSFFFASKPSKENNYSVLMNDKDIINYLDSLFSQSNTGKLQLLHSMSVSDVVKFGERYFYCDIFGWKDITKEVK